MVVPWRKIEDDVRTDGERLREVVMIDKDYKEMGGTCSGAEERKIWKCSDAQRDVPGACRCSRRWRDKRTQKTAEGGLKMS